MIKERFYPKGGMCAACQHALADCSHLDFASMRVLTRSEGNAYVICTGFAGRKFGDLEPKAKRKAKYKDPNFELNREADAVIEALESTLVRVKVDEIPESKLDACNYGIELLANALRRYAEDVRKGEVL
ncbi:hypothetical protein KUW19_00740 [Ferrimonas balearica]|uniref:hypothetical protein n=1 Tax=Ferrimonas balearica TaxID=44012 RepID=UPI001C944CC3|nr:hypothetical protein [Ferrimonas balearica]MBY6105003.1 hypothetical protein [Ferrimonas balearica]